MARKRKENTKQDFSKPRNRQEKNPSKKNGRNNEDEDVEVLKNQLAKFGLTLREVPGDGNCLFRALSDQLDGHMGNHLRHRSDTAQYMLENCKDFEPFVEDDIPFERHLSSLREPGTYVGNDAIVAFARLHQVTIVIHQPNAPLWRVQGLAETDESGVSNSANQKRNSVRTANQRKEKFKELHIGYHGGDHYDSVRKIGDTGHLPANITLSVLPKSEKDDDPPETFAGLGPKEEITDLEKEAMELSGCTEILTVRQLLENNFYNLDAAVEDLITLSLSNNVQDPEVPTTEKNESSNAGTSSQSRIQRKQVSTRKQERQKKIERKKRANEEQKNAASTPQPIQTDLQFLSI